MRWLFIVGICAWAQVEQPRIGMMLDASGSARPVFGVSASVTLGDPVIADVVSLACARFCIAKTQDAIVTGSHSVAAPRGPAIFAFSEDAVYVYASGQLWRWRGGDLEALTLNITGEVLSMRVDGGSVEFAVRRDDGTWIVRDGNVAVESIPDATGPVFLLPHAILFAAGDEIVLRRADSTEMRFPVHADSFVRISTEYVQIRSGRSSYALRVASGREKLFLLPEAP